MGSVSDRFETVGPDQLPDDVIDSLADLLLGAIEQSQPKDIDGSVDNKHETPGDRTANDTRSSIREDLVPINATRAADVVAGRPRHGLVKGLSQNEF